MGRRRWWRSSSWRIPIENSGIYPFVDQQAHELGAKGPQKELITVAPDDDQSIIYGLIILSPFWGFESLGRFMERLFKLTSMFESVTKHNHKWQLRCPLFICIESSYEIFIQPKVFFLQFCGFKIWGFFSITFFSNLLSFLIKKISKCFVTTVQNFPNKTSRSKQQKVTQLWGQWEPRVIPCVN